jgi:hypothetical protein
MKASLFVALQFLSFLMIAVLYSGCSSASVAQAQTVSEVRVVERF